MNKLNVIDAAPAKGEIGIVHLGLGAFHRAHQAVYLERYRQRTGDSSWGVCAANLRGNVTLVDALRQANYTYHVAEYANREHITVRTIGVIEEALFTGQDEFGQWGRDLPVLLARMSAPATRIVTLTVTEKGYFLNPADGQLIKDQTLVAEDIAHPESPRTALGIIVAALARRRAANVAPFTVLSCDNMPDNGQRTRAAVLQLAALHDPKLAQWIETEVAFPSTMVDRIVPAMAEDDFARLAELGVKDPNAVIGEAFSQWVIEDDFPLGRPSWELDGVQMVASVAPFETMKLRLLNGSHSLLAYLGALEGILTVFEAVARADLAAFLRRYMLTDAAPTLSVPDSTDIAAYCEQLLARFGNDSLRHRLQQIAMDGSQKLPQRWLHGARECLAQGRSIPCTALGVAAWIRYTTGQDLHGQTYPVNDPMASVCAELHRQHTDTVSLVAAFLSLDAVFPPELARHTAFAHAVCTAFDNLQTQGLTAALSLLTE